MAHAECHVPGAGCRVPRVACLTSLKARATCSSRRALVFWARLSPANPTAASHLFGAPVLTPCWGLSACRAAPSHRSLALSSVGGARGADESLGRRADAATAQLAAEHDL
eukprot:3713623-Rhodomonas_salina.2